MKTFISSIIIILILGAVTFGVIRYLDANTPQAERKEMEEVIPIVKVIELSASDVELPLTSEGLVYARRDTVITAEVAGRITEMHPNFEVGGSFRAGEPIAQLDQVNYQAALAQAKSALADAKLALKQEVARGEQAARDWKKIGGRKPASEMVLRVPFLESAKARVVSMEAMLEKAAVDLDRTRILAPFDCRVRQTNLDLGATVAPGSRVGVVYDPSQLLVRLPFNLDDFSQLPEQAKVTLTTDIASQEYTWEGRVLWTEGDLDRRTLSAYVIAEILPRAAKEERFKLPPPGLFVQAEISGAKIPNVIKLPRQALRGRDQVSVMNAQDELEFRKLTITRSSVNHVYVSEGLSSGERVILTKLEFPVAGMKLAIASEQP